MRGIKRFFFTLLTLGIVGTLAIVGTVWALDNFTGTGPFTSRCTADIGDLGIQKLAPDQADNAALITAIAMQRDLPARAATIGIATAMQESKMRNIDYGDRDSLGMFQQRPSQGWGTEEQVQDVRYATEAFFDVLARIKGYDDMPVTVAAQAVQRSAFPDAYAQHEDVARAFASALSGYAGPSLNCRLPAAETSEVPGFLARLAADFPTLAPDDGQWDLVPESDASGPKLVLSGVDFSSEQQLWAVANWSVAVADTYGVVAVSAGGYQWTRDEPWTANNDSNGITVTFAGTN